MAPLHELVELLGSAQVLQGAQAEPYSTDWRERYAGTPLAVVRPGNTSEVAQVVRWCLASRVPIVPQGGNTGLCGAATPDGSGTALILSLGRLNRIRSVDTDNDTLVAEAGCVLQSVQDAARDADRLFPLSLAAEGSCTIGGNLATNAGGTQVLRYGTARELVLGLEIVTAEGEILHGLKGLRKDNTGYAVQELYMGSEGTLGIITAATLKLFPLPVARCTALLALGSMEQAVGVLSAARKGLGASLTGFEVISGHCLHAVVACFPEQRIPFSGQALHAPWYAVLELSDSESAQHGRERFEAVVGAALEQGLITDAVIAESVSQAKALWHLRESIPLAEKAYGKNIKHDISLPISRIPEFVRSTNAALQQRYPGVEHIIFGHLGDGNLHYNVAPGGIWTEDALIQEQNGIYELVHGSVHRYGGSISAEHGVGQLKRDMLPRYKDPVELALMRRIKQALDPHGIMNPGKVLAP